MAKYFGRLAADLEHAARTGEAPNTPRKTRLWEEFLPPAVEEESRSRRHAWEARVLNAQRRWGL
eukprot:1690213-Lingulodinium_polyedra.AAC.1